MLAANKGRTVALPRHIHRGFIRNPKLCLLPFQRSTLLEYKISPTRIPNHLSAYRICLKYEQEHAAFRNKLRHVRILGFLLLHALNRGVRSEVAKCIHSCKDSSDLTDFGAFFERNVILPCESSICHLYSLHVIHLPSYPVKKHKGRTPKSSEHPSRPSFEAVKDEMKLDIAQAPRKYGCQRSRQ
ncbi:hypothetical protein J3R83DRAFT_10165 [Lanmaoa asiatica]|nr:hypothetical protein J3R83DRAFT_10165 [Lanmaoa asiatica]